MKKHLSKAQISGTALLVVCFALATGTLFSSTKIAMFLIALICFLGLCYLTILIHSFKSSK